MRALAALAAMVFAVGASAAPVERSPIPLPRGGVAAQVEVPQPLPVAPPLAMSALLKTETRPKPRPKGLKQGAGAKTVQARAQSAKGSVCGVAAIKGQVIAAIPGRVQGCGVANPVRITSVSGVALSTPATVDCPTAQALNTWVSKSVVPIVGNRGQGVKSLHIAAHYACRSRNNQRGARISEHGRGRAIDIAAINLKNGTQLRVLGGWRDGSQGPVLKKLHKAACGPFGTVLGPNSDRFHQDHFHLDTARYRSGPYCR